MQRFSPEARNGGADANTETVVDSTNSIPDTPSVPVEPIPNLPAKETVEIDGLQSPVRSAVESDVNIGKTDSTSATVDDGWLGIELQETSHGLYLLNALRDSGSAAASGGFSVGDTIIKVCHKYCSYYLSGE